ncbi:hypothetical protein Q7P35_005144 [Cladosporium inversicolor]
MSAHPTTSQRFDPITLPGATILSFGENLPEEKTHLHNENPHNEHLAEATRERIFQQLKKRDLDNYRLGHDRGFAEGMCISMVAWVIVSLISKCFGEHEGLVKGVLMGIYIFVFAQ